MIKPSLTVVIPAYNEQGNLDQAIANVHRIVGGLVDDYEIIIVNDASQDQTFAVAQQKAKENKRIRL